MEGLNPKERALAAGESPLRVGLLCLPSFPSLGLAAVAEPLAIANWLSQKRLFQWTLLSLDGEPVQASNGLSSQVEAGISPEQEFDLCFVIASFDVHRHCRNNLLKSWLRKQALFGAVLVGVETGTELLAAAGVLDGYDAAVHWDNLPGFQESYPRVRSRAQLYCLDRQRLTCAGAAAILDMMLTWLGSRIDADLAREIGMHLLVGQVRAPTESQLDDGQRAEPLHEGKLRRAVRLMEQTLEEPLDCEAIASRVGLSRRQLERQFKQHTGLSPLKYYIALRLARAHNLLQQTNLSVSQVAASSGFGSLEHFSRAYRARFGCPPSEDRSQTWTAPVMRQPLTRQGT
ncbi:GlxA family transcriptional regulator [Metapseudomonas furukawaii]|uniref:Transcriptional regulator containing an amidase domain and an AraC-type DNA-binding HTH domain n=1 Tax=Metapseudomonas furukawaii TaxID=1149133 RepID=L8MQM5_METFU|nr:GlxA family transcriptional regulator [Pseudomonas furukawaii]ELS25409.1 Transcriptional regulator [Pseudomonas furukawaii]ELS29159.1 Transcriptional regulator [Pseudomonas furukawaii]BAU73938.1 transcriptional regulator containing an amidase domain and an AraC-type DNA-binding HTH domain [Pseudomonas furukawaii]